MNVLLVSKRFGSSACLCLTKGKLLTAAAALFVAVPVLSLYAGYQLAGGVDAQGSDEVSVVINQELDKQQQEISEARRVAEENLNALTMRLGQMQAHVIRLDALGQRLTRMGWTG